MTTTALDAFHPDECEMHPHGDELLCLLAGAVDVVLEEPAGRIVLREPADLLFVTPPAGTQLCRARGR